MAVSVMILGVSGTGKSASMRNCKSDKFALVNVAKKPLPFKGNFSERYDGDNYQQAVNFMKNCKAKSIVIDDAQYLMGNEFMRRVTERGFDKFSEMAQNMWKLLNFINQDLPADKIVYLLGHIERDQDGNEKFKTMGKLIDQCINVEGTCTIVLKTHVADGEYSFLTQNSGHDTVKSPIGMFPSLAINNDLNYVDEKIRNYYELGEFLSDDEVAEIDETAKKVDMPLPGEKKKSRRAKAMDAEISKGAEPEETTEKPKRARRKATDSVEEREAKREEVIAKNADAVANAGVSDDEEMKEFTSEDMPTLEKAPRRKKRELEDPREELSPEEKAEQEAKVEAAEEAAPTRRRRRK